MIKIKATCRCGRVETVEVDRLQLRKYIGGQHVFRELTKDQLEIVIAQRTGSFLCSVCRDSLDEE